MPVFVRPRWGQWWSSFDEKRMVLIIENDDDDSLLEFSAHYEVCGLCDGTGRHVNPSIDSNGLTCDDFAEDPDFAENYLGGMYDTECYQCKGLRVIPHTDDPRADKFKERFYENCQERASEMMREDY